MCSYAKSQEELEKMISFFLKKSTKFDGLVSTTKQAAVLQSNESFGWITGFAGTGKTLCAVGKAIRAGAKVPNGPGMTKSSKDVDAKVPNGPGTNKESKDVEINRVLILCWNTGLKEYLSLSDFISHQPT